MDIDFKSYKDSVSDALQHSGLERALTGLDNMVAAIQAPARYRDAIENLRANYRLLKQYALDGAEDPQRAAMTARMKEDARRLSAELERHYLMQQSPAVYYSTLRFEQKQPESGIAGLIDSLRQMKEMQGRRMLSGEPSVQSADEEALRQLQRRLFDRVWVTFPMSNADTDALNRLLSDTTTSRTLKLHLTAALLLGALNTFDHARVETLARLYMHHNADAAISTAALCAIVLIGMTHRQEISSAQSGDALHALAAQPGWGEQVRMAHTQIVRTADTDRVTDKVNNEIIPGMMSHKAEIEDMFGKMNLEELGSDPADMEMNPEWEEMLNKSGLADRLRQFSELQADGSDVMMSTFSHLKSYPFFHDVANWFLPFSADNALSAASHMPAELLTMLEKLPMLCDNDLYSLVFSTARIPEAQRRMMSEQLRAAGVQLAEMHATSLDSDRAEREAYARRFLQNLYRFVRLFRRKEEFADPFSHDAALEVTGCVEGLDSPEHVRLLAEFYFKRGYHAHSVACFRKLIDEAGVNEAQVYQKLGFAYQSMHDFKSAAEMYDNADLINSDDRWTLRHLASCQMRLADYAGALDTMKRLERLGQEDAGAAIRMARCLTELGRHNEALDKLLKADYLTPDNPRVLSMMAWTQLLTSDLDGARDTMHRILAGTPTDTDYLNAGHLAMRERRYRDAVELYRRCAEVSSRESFETRFNYDRIRHPELFPADDMAEIVLEEVLDTND